MSVGTIGEQNRIDTFSIPAGKRKCIITGDLYQDNEHERNLQTLAKRLVSEYGYKLEQLGRKSISIKMGSKRYYPDIVAYHDNAYHERENVNLIVEIEPEKTDPSDPNHGVDQAKSYLQMLPNCKYGLWYNRTQQTCLYKESPDVEPIEINDIPPYGLEIEDIERPNFDQLRPAFELRSVFKRCHNYIAGIEGLRKEEAFHELLKIIFCKVLDEEISIHVKFYVTNNERKKNPERCKSRIEDIFNHVKKVHKEIFEKTEIIKLDATVVAFLVSQLQGYTLINSDTDVKGEAYEEIVGGNLRGDRGEYFTPRTVCRAAVEMLFHTFATSSWDDLSVIDPACGTGGFLTAIINFLKEHFFKLEMQKWKNREKAVSQVKDRLKSFCERNLHAIDINPTLARAAQMNEVMHGNGHGNVFSANSLRASSEWKQVSGKKLELGQFSLLFTNPPFGSKIPITDPKILRQFDLGHIWEERDGNWCQTERLSVSVPPEQLFVERSIDFLKSGGRAGMIIADHILTNPGYEYVRQWILENTKVLARIFLPEDTFQPFVGTKAHLIILEKKKNSEIGLGKSEYRSYGAIGKHIGHDQRGTPEYLRTPEGEEILWNVEKDVIRVVQGKKITEKTEITEKVINDDMPVIVKEFKKWWDENYG